MKPFTSASDEWADWGPLLSCTFGPIRWHADVEAEVFLGSNTPLNYTLLHTLRTDGLDMVQLGELPRNDETITVMEHSVTDFSNCWLLCFLFPRCISE